MYVVAAMLVELFVILVTLYPDQIFWRNFHLTPANLFYIILGTNLTELYPSTQPVGVEKKERKKERK